ncbi:hypothetical protein EJF18_50516 [Clavispora lusitaniae]|uniref:Uncharacterized protein n=1 Tax=Clavispora lusitaniae TaxID=36911 RepID=A0ACD0WP43_CLALS|nr:hypothetical protein EJF14_50516 [Clavispora lusitaniae]QFZ34947.1 hypothetical protein EJF16_50516 [Clavispora lusitaniae]QFZ40632.1 hypothetical protein EJF15_50516 [Clavispora lusitaniae]QFZ46312.1 hypothetical protein EJF18_50516 [Clavispora lusitaniae]QFZ51974.1 hypothetical protein EJF17_50516 [Clavispora lusitaniae]
MSAVHIFRHCTIFAETKSDLDFIIICQQLQHQCFHKCQRSHLEFCSQTRTASPLAEKTTEKRKSTFQTNKPFIASSCATCSRAWLYQPHRARNPCPTNASTFSSVFFRSGVYLREKRRLMLAPPVLPAGHRRIARLGLL